MIPGDEWWKDHGEIARLLRHMNETECLDVDICVDVVSKPWHWDAEYQAMCVEQLKGHKVASERDTDEEAEQKECPCYRVLTIDEMLGRGVPKGQMRTVHQPDCPMCDGTGVAEDEQQ